MFNFNIDFARLIKDNIPSFLHLPRRINFLTVLMKPFKIIWNDFNTKRNELLYKSLINPGVISLETILNDEFDPVNRAIFISDVNYQKLFLYMRVELKPPMILYRKWNNVSNFVTGKFCFYQGNIYVSNTTPNINKVPGIAPEWTLDPVRKAPVLRKKIDYSGQIAFYVNVPNTLVYSQFKLHAIMKAYKAAGPGYLIKTF